MAEAEVGDEQHFGDPTVNALCERVAELLGFEAAVFLPSGTMCNAIGFRIHIRAGGDEAYLHRTSHPLKAEAGGPAAISGAVLCPLEGERGMFDAATLAAAMRPPDDRYSPRSRLVSVEQTTNLSGGHVWPLAQLREVVEVAKANRLRLHMDGARLMNAVVASGIPTTEWTAGFDTAWIDFSKGLGAPMGAVMAGSRELIDEAWRYKQMMGGALRQAGIVAAGALWALDHHVERLAMDHDNARTLARGLADIPGITIDPDEVATNIVIFQVADAHALCTQLAASGVIMGALDARTVRAVTHVDVGAEDIATALDVVGATLATA
jgi:threonine aldolase